VPLTLEDFEKLPKPIIGPPEYIAMKRRARLFFELAKAAGYTISIETPYGYYPDQFPI
jgi:hypothetical protein